jgi:hypothetical protein
MGYIQVRTPLVMNPSCLSNRGRIHFLHRENDVLVFVVIYSWGNDAQQNSV